MEDGSERKATQNGTPPSAVTPAPASSGSASGAGSDAGSPDTGSLSAAADLPSASRWRQFRNSWQEFNQEWAAARKTARERARRERDAVAYPSATASLALTPSFSGNQHFLAHGLALQHWILLFAAVVTTLMLSLIASNLWEERRLKLEQAVMGAESLARTLEEHSARTFFSVDQLFQDMDYVLALRPETKMRGSPTIRDYLAQRERMMPQLAGIVVFDHQGRVQHHSAPTALPNTLFADLPFFATHSELSTAGLLIDRPTDLVDLAEGTIIPLSRRVERLEGGFAGVATALVSANYFERFYQSVRGPLNAAAMLVHRNGTVLVRSPGNRLLTGNEADNAKLLKEWFGNSGEGTRTVMEPHTGHRLIVSVRRTSDYPLFQIVVVNEQDVLRPWYRNFITHGIVALAIASTVGALAGFLNVRFRREKAAYNRLEEASNLITSVLNSMVDAVITIDGLGVIRSFNPAASAMFGYDAEAVVGQKVNLLMPDPPAGEHDRFLVAYHRSGRDQPLPGGREVLVVRKDKSTFPALLSVSRMRYGIRGDRAISPRSGRPMFVGVIRDITAWKETEAALIASKTEAEAAARTKSEFLANMSHELRTPLNAIIGFSELLDSEFFGSLNDRQKACIRDIQESGNHLLDIINAVLDMAKIEAGRYELSEEVVVLPDVLESCLTMIREQASSGGIALVNGVEAITLPQVWADKRALRQVLLNVLANAVKFTPAGGTVSIQAECSPEQELVLAVRDTGIGISPEAMSRIFEPFHQADASTSRSYGGTGLGLTISRDFMQLHGGRISLESEPGLGTTVRLHLPAQRILNGQNFPDLGSFFKPHPV